MLGCGEDHLPHVSFDAKVVEPEGTVQVTLRIKRSVLQTFRATGKGYQSRMNAVLESYARTLRK
jgi:uncharacterized protein (DUF4415 family)